MRAEVGNSRAGLLVMLVNKPFGEGRIEVWRAIMVRGSDHPGSSGISEWGGGASVESYRLRSARSLVSAYERRVGASKLGNWQVVSCCESETGPDKQ